MRWIASITLALCAIADSSIVWWHYIGIGGPILTLSLLIALYAILDLRRILVPLLVAGLTLDLYSGLRFGTITAVLLISFLLTDLLRGKSLRSEGLLPTFILAFGAVVAWLATYIVATMATFGTIRLSVPWPSVGVTLILIAVLAVISRSLVERLMGAVGYFPKGSSI